MAVNSDNFTNLVSSLILLLLVATVVALVTRKLKIPYVIGLVVAGLFITPETLPRSISLNADVILNLFLPILIFEAAINTEISRLRDTVKPIALLAGPGVLISALITTLLLRNFFDFPWLTAAAISVILSITDTVSVIAAFKSVVVPSPLANIVENESLFNDGVALVLINIITTILLEGSFSWGGALMQTFVAFVGGGALGLGLGYLCVGLFQQLDDALSSILLTVAVSLGSFQIGQLLEVSGAISVVITGLVVGNLGFSKTSAGTRVTLLNFWEYAGFGVNTFLFLVLGISIDLSTVIQTFPLAILAIIAYQIGRVFAIYPLSYLLKFFDRPLPLKWQHILIWGNVKGSLSMALAISLPSTLPLKNELVTIVFSTVLLSLLGQGLSLSWFVKKLKISTPSIIKQKIEQLQLNLITAKSAQKELKNLLDSGSLSKSLYEEIFSGYQVKIADAENKLREYYNQRPSHQNSTLENLYLDGLLRRLYIAEKSAITDALRKGILTEDSALDYLQQLDEKLLSLRDE
ncbi:MAG: sodium:proton antiporter [Cyanobacterium sp. T60_A2020_053]|nr:sodium:proton antiporter [Cyanobacterium sp. T60_A2020_053]